MDNPKEHLFRIRVFLNDKNKKPIRLILKEVISLWYLKRSFPLFYFGRFFYRNGMPFPKRMLNFKEYYQVLKSPKVNSPEYKPYLTNKLAFSLFCEKHAIPSPETLSHNMGNNFFLEGKMYRVNNKKKCLDFFNRLFELTGEEYVFVKSVAGSGGKEVHKLSKNVIAQDIDDVFDDLVSSSYIHQKAIIQHPILAKINPHSVNTLRLCTYIDEQRKTHFLGHFMRFGSEGRPVDNVSSGGFCVPFDLETGRLEPIAFKAMISGGNEITEHPDSKFKFEGFEIPFYEETLEFALRLSEMLPNRLIGWDFAFTSKGPIVIEANDFPGFLDGELTQGGYMDHPIYKDIILN